MANYTTRAASLWAAQVPRGTDFFDQKADLFLGHHKNVVNVFLHMITTPVGLVGAVSLLRCMTASTSIATYFVLLYLISLAHFQHFYLKRLSGSRLT